MTEHLTADTPPDTASILPGRAQRAIARRRYRPGIGLIGAGAFGGFCVPYLRRIGTLTIFDPNHDLSAFADEPNVRVAELADVARQDVVILAVPFDQLRVVTEQIGPYLRPGAVVIDVCSIKVKPLALLRSVLPAHVSIVGTHPLFGPQSGKHGIAGLPIAVCPERGPGQMRIVRVLRRLGLNVTVVTPEEHDRQMAYVQGLTHLLGRAIAALDLPPFPLTTPTYDLLIRMSEMVRHDSDALFRTILVENPHAAEACGRLLDEMARLQATSSRCSSTRSPASSAAR